MKMWPNGAGLKYGSPDRRIADSPPRPSPIAELLLVTAIPAKTGMLKSGGRRSTGVNRRDHHRAGIISPKHSDFNRLRLSAGMALPVIELRCVTYVASNVEHADSVVSVEITAIRW